MLDKLAAIERRFNQIEARLADPTVATDPTAVRELAQERAELEPIVGSYRRLLEVEAQLAQAEQMLEDEDPEMRALAEAEVEDLEATRKRLERQLQVMLLPPNPLDEKDVILEIRAGTGGDEAALFAADLARMYMRYAEERGWESEIVSANEIGIGGYREIVLTIRGKGAYSRLKYESGVHRVQRIPRTESSGRIHTSTATVAVLPELEEIELDLDPDDIEMEVYRSSGPGGQHMQKNATAVRLIHKPTGMVVACQSERSQAQNRARALAVLRSRLYAAEEEKRSSAVDAERRAQVGTAERSEKIRTYNFPQSRVTDHRLGMTSHRLTYFLDGDLDEFVDALLEREEEQRLKEIASGQSAAA
ncbi:MAG: peptide chain release factor 1 [Anaerolineae bacterium]|nr:peptide chain release factor 1 [Anaerolineae bacterium]